MERNNTYFKNMYLEWSKFSDYEYNFDEKGDKIIIISKKAKKTAYNVFDVAIDMIIDLINLGKKVCENKATESTDNTLAFVKKYGNYSKDGVISPAEIMGQARIFYEAYLQLSKIIIEEKLSKKKDIKQLIDVVNISFSLKIKGNTPFISVSCDSIFDVLSYIFITLMNDDSPRIYQCKHCGNIFFAEHGKMAFDTPQCRNQYNVYRHREKFRG